MTDAEKRLRDTLARMDKATLIEFAVERLARALSVAVPLDELEIDAALLHAERRFDRALERELKFLNEEGALDIGKVKELAEATTRAHQLTMKVFARRNAYFVDRTKS